MVIYQDTDLHHPVGAEKKAGKRIRCQHIFPGAILDNYIVVTKELHPFGLDEGKL